MICGFLPRGVSRGEMLAFSSSADLCRFRRETTSLLKESGR